MSKDKISDYSATANSNTDIGGINIDEGCAPSGINDAIRTLMKQLKDWQSGSQDVYIHPAGSASVPSITATGDTNTGLFFPAADTVGITTGGTERARVDSSGNLGLGVTPSASSNLTNIEMPQGVQIGARKLSGYPQMYLSSNVSGDAYSPTYKINGYATQYRLESSAGKHEWYTAPSGTAGNAISFTQAMTLDASGRLLIGATSQSGGVASRLYIKQTTDSAYSGINVVTAASQEWVGSFSLDSSGNINIAQSYLGAGSYQGITLTTSGSERMRIDSSGNLLLNTTSTLGTTWFNVYGATSSKNGIGIQNSSDTGTIYSLFIRNASNTTIGSINNNGSTTSFTTTSDYRLKENIQPMTGALAKVSALKPCTYTWKESGFNSQGFIAHELQAVVPDAVVGEKDAVDADGNPVYQGIDTSFLVATLTAAIQELNAKFEAYKAAHP